MKVNPMAILQSTQRHSMYSARPRPKLVSHEAATPIASPAPVEPMTAPVEVSPAPPMRRNRLTELEQRQLLIETVTLYPDWLLISLQSQPGSDIMVAHLIRTNDRIDPAVAIKEGRTMQITLSALGEMQVQYARRRRASQPISLWKRLAGFFSVLFQ